MTNQRRIFDPFMEENAIHDLSESPAYWLSNGDLPPALNTGHAVIDQEHRFLVSAIANLRKVCIDQVRLKDCKACGRDRQRQCEGQVVSMLGDVFAFILDHFATEESLMRESLLVMVDRDLCEAHMEDHAAISLAAQKIVSSLDAEHIVSRIRELDALFMRWITNHMALHDMILSRWISRDDYLFGSS